MVDGYKPLSIGDPPHHAICSSGSLIERDNVLFRGYSDPHNISIAGLGRSNITSVPGGPSRIMTVGLSNTVKYQIYTYTLPYMFIPSTNHNGLSSGDQSFGL